MPTVKKKSLGKSEKPLALGRVFADTLNIQKNMKHYSLTSPTRQQLSHILFEGLEQFGGAVDIKGVVFTSISSVEREDGSGMNYNVYGYDNRGNKANAFVRCVL